MGCITNGGADLVSYFNYIWLSYYFHSLKFANMNTFFSEFLADEALNFKRYCNESQLQH